QEFYASFRDQESKKPFDNEIWQNVTVKGKKVHVIPWEICEFYNAPYYEFEFVENSDLEYFRNINMYNIINYLTEDK
ncbi:hypothetical protein J1N35_029087, partial [Gossypium stocksii]